MSTLKRTCDCLWSCDRSKLNRKTFSLCLLTVLGASFVYYHQRLTIDVDAFYSSFDELDSDTCELPRPDPWDPTILKYISRPKPLVCKKLQPEATYLDNGLLYVNASELQSYGYTSLLCEFRCFDRIVDVNDVDLVYDEWRQFSADTPANVSRCDFVETRCSKTFPIAVSVYSNFHSQCAVNRTELARLEERASSSKNASAFIRPSVLLFVIDSTSHSNFVRQLPKTLKFLREEMQVVEFRGHTKVGDNSFPNAIAMFTGRRAYSSELPEDDMKKMFYDDWPVVWKDFRRAGYMTYYAEDVPDFNIFNYIAIGFRRKPVDHYFRPYWLALLKTFLHLRSTTLCFGNSPLHELQLHYLADFLREYDDRRVPRFAINWLTELPHEWLNQVALGDDSFEHFFRKMQPHLTNTITFVLSDHGHRIGQIRESAIGRIEDRMPFFSVALPPWMRERYPELVDVLKNNSQLLTSPFDLHATLLDIITNDFGTADLAPVQSRQTSQRGRSLLRPIPMRTCERAGIPADFCVCEHAAALNVSDERVQRAALVLVAHLNSLLRANPIALRNCAELKLESVRSAELVVPNARAMRYRHSGAIPRPSGFFVSYRLVVVAAPSGGAFEALVRDDNVEASLLVRAEKLSVVGDVSRVNRYGNQSVCIDSAVLRKFCFCPGSIVYDG